MRRSAPHPIPYMIPWAHPSPQPKQHLDLFNRFCTAHRRVSLYLTMGRPFSPQNCPFPWGSGPPSNTWFPGPTRVLNPNGISIGWAAGLTSVADRPTDHVTRSVIIGCIYVVVLRCGLKTQFIHNVNGYRSKTAKIIKRWYYLPFHRLYVNVMLSNTNFLWFFFAVFDLSSLTLWINCIF